MRPSLSSLRPDFHSSEASMSRVTNIRKLGFVGGYLPRKCGIATFTTDLCGAVAGQYRVGRLQRRSR